MHSALSDTLRTAVADARAEARTVLRTGRVTLAEKNTVMLKGEARPAQVAASCLLAPEPGDEVLYAALADGRAFITAVLCRGESPAIVRFPHGVELQADMDMSIASRTRLTLNAPHSALEAVQLSVDAATVDARAGTCSLLAGTLRAAGECLESCFARLKARLGSSRRIVAGHDDTQAGSSRLAVSGSAVLQGESIHQTAVSMVRIDAKQVHLS